MNTSPELPRWIIDDTTRPGHILCTHNQEPRFTGELLAHDDVPEDSEVVPASDDSWIVIEHWLDGGPSFYEEQDMCDSLDAALKQHEAAKKIKKPKSHN